MPAYNFKAQFADDVENGRKRQTIRPKRKRPTRPGEMLYLFTGMGTKQCRKLRSDVCTEIIPIEIHAHRVKLGSKWLEISSMDNLAQSDGFESSTEFINWFKNQYGQLPFNGELIKW